MRDEEDIAVMIFLAMVFRSGYQGKAQVESAFSAARDLAEVLETKVEHIEAREEAERKKRDERRRNP